MSHPERPLLLAGDINNCPGRRGRLIALSVFLCKSVLYGAFVWVRQALKHQKLRFPARAVLLLWEYWHHDAAVAEPPDLALEGLIDSEMYPEVRKTPSWPRSWANCSR